MYTTKGDYMFPGKKVCVALGLLFLSSLFGCGAWHEDLMSNNQLMAASCDQLAKEEAKLADNAAQASGAGTFSAVSSALLMGLEMMAASATGTSYDVQHSAAMNQAGMGDAHYKQASELEQRQNLLATLRRKKGCL